MFLPQKRNNYVTIEVLANATVGIIMWYLNVSNINTYTLNLLNVPCQLYHNWSKECCSLMLPSILTENTKIILKYPISIKFKRGINRGGGKVVERSVFLFYSGLYLIGWGPPTLGRAICFTQFANSNVSLIQKHLYG